MELPETTIPVASARRRRNHCEGRATCVVACVHVHVHVHVRGVSRDGAEGVGQRRRRTGKVKGGQASSAARPTHDQGEDERVGDALHHALAGGRFEERLAYT